MDDTDIGKGLSALIPARHASQGDAGRPPKDDQPAGTVPETERRTEPQRETSVAKKPIDGGRAQAEPREPEEREPEEPPARKEIRREFIFHIETEKIKPNPYQPRREYKEGELQELAQSIREFGIIQPLIVSHIERETERGTDVSYQLISGERRLRAAKLAGLKQVPAVVRREPAGSEKLSLALIENLQRSDLNPIEAARGYARLQDEFRLTQREIAVKMGKSRSAIANALRLLGLPSHMQKALEAGKLTESQGRTLLQETNPHLQEERFQKLLSGTPTRAVAPRTARPAKAETRKEPFWEKQIEHHLGAPVSVERFGERGKVTITFFSEEEWNELRKKLTEPDGEETDSSA